MSEQPSASPSRGVQLAEITNGLVRLHHEYYGKGPTKAKTYAVNDTILCILHGGFTTVEQTLMADGKIREVEEMRRSFQETMRTRFVAVVEASLDRHVIGYMSQVNADPEVAVELFLLAPAGAPIQGEHEVESDELTPGRPPRGT
jgi:uncharacterized protein YbcI